MQPIVFYTEAWIYIFYLYLIKLYSPHHDLKKQKVNLAHQTMNEKNIGHSFTKKIKTF